MQIPVCPTCDIVLRPQMYEMILNVVKVLSAITFDPKCNTGPKCNKFLPNWGNVIEVLSVITFALTPY